MSKQLEERLDKLEVLPVREILDLLITVSRLNGVDSYLNNRDRADETQQELNLLTNILLLKYRS